MEIKNVHCEKQALELFRMMPDNKKSSLHNALSRNLEFTTSFDTRRQAEAYIRRRTKP